MSALVHEETIGSSEFQRSVGEYLDKVRGGETALIVHAHGRRHIVMVAAAIYDELVEARRQLRQLRAE